MKPAQPELANNKVAGRSAPSNSLILVSVLSYFLLNEHTECQKRKNTTTRSSKIFYFFQVERYRARIQICKGNITVSSLNLIEKVDHDDDAYDPITFILIQKNGKELHNNNKWIAVYLKINARNLARWHGFCFTG